MIAAEPARNGGINGAISGTDTEAAVNGRLVIKNFLCVSFILLPFYLN